MSIYQLVNMESMLCRNLTLRYLVAHCHSMNTVYLGNIHTSVYNIILLLFCQFATVN